MRRSTQSHRWIAGAIGLALYLLLPGQALAVDQTYVPVGSFGSGPGAGAGELDHPRRVAVDEATGDVYVVDRENDRVVVFRPGEDPAATYLTSFGEGALADPFGIAIDPNGGAVYVTSAGTGEIVKFTSDGASTPTFTVDLTFVSPGPGSGAADIGDFDADLAVDPNNGDLLVADPGSDEVKRFSAGGAYVSGFDGATSPDGAFVGLLDIDIAPNGDVYVVDSEGPVFIEGEPEGGTGPCVQNAYCNGDPSRVERFSSSGAHIATIVPLESTGYGLVAYDPTNGQVMVGRVVPQGPSLSTWHADGSGFITQFSHGGFTATYGIAASGGAMPRAYQVTDQIFHVTNNETIGEVSVRAFEPVNFPTVLEPIQVSEVGETSAHLSGEVNPNGVPTEIWFEYTRDGFSWQSTPTESIGDGETPVAVEFDLENLAPNVNYEARLVARNSANVQRTSAPVAFKTEVAAPGAITVGAAPRTQTTARLNGWVNPLNSDATYYFEWGPTSAYGNKTPAPDAPLTGEASLAVSAQLDGLTPGTTFHFRLVAESAAGTSFGEDLTFTTRTAAETGPRKRGIELVNNPDKGNQAADTPIGDGTPIATADGGKILWTTTGGGPGTSTGSGNTFMAERSADGWHSRSLLPPPAQLVDEGDGKYTPLDANPGFDDFLFEVTSGILTSAPRSFAAIDLAKRHRLIGQTGPTSNNTRIQANDDFSHVYTNAETPEHPEHPLGTIQVYDYGSNPPELVSVMPNDTPPDCGVTNQTSYSQWASNGYDWISSDPDAPARAFFETDGEGPCVDALNIKLYMRDLDAGTTTLISGPALPGGPQGEQGAFIRASADASVVIFSARSRLTAEDDNDVGDIYRYVVGQGHECLTCVGPGGGVQVSSSYNRPFAVSDDLKRIYFVGSNVLVPGAGRAGAQNLYLWEEGEIEYVAPLGFSWFSGETSDWSEEGGVLYFRSTDPEVTTDETKEAEQIYRYDEEDRSVECITCPSSSYVTWGYAAANENAGLASSAEEGDSFVFETASSLTHRDVNNDADIYEWRNGQLALVTDGVTQYPEGTGRLQLVGMGRDGLNVLFLAGVNFTGYERDNVGQYYVARVGGGFPKPALPPPPCGEESCQGPLPAPAPVPAPGSQTNEGKGNVDPVKKPRRKCGKGKVRKGKAAAKRCGKKKSKKSHHGKRRNG